MSSTANDILHALILWSWQSLLLIAFVTLVSRIRPAVSARTRHLLWVAAIIEIALLPLQNQLIPLLPVATVPAIAPGSIAGLPVSIAAIAVTAQRSITWQSLVGPTIVGFWAVGVLISAIRPCRNYWWSRRARASGHREVRVDLPIPLIYSRDCSVPALVGIVHPAVLLPEDIESWTNSEQLQGILLHEVAHLERRDHWTSVLQSFLASVFFFHPAVRFALKQVATERELACDEKVLATGLRPTVYAETILKVAERNVQVPQEDCPAFHSKKLLERRITMILEERFSSTGTRSRTRDAFSRIAVVIAAAALLIPQPPIAAKPQTPVEAQSPSVAAEPKTPPAPSSPTPQQREIQIAAATPVQVAIQQGVPEARQGIFRYWVGWQQQNGANAPQGTLSGTISDQTGARVPGVSLTLTGGPTLLTAVTNDTGSYTFSGVEPGQYKLLATLPGFQSTDRSIAIRPGMAERLNVILPLAKMMTVVEVSVAKPQTPPNAPTPAATTPTRIGGVVAAPMLLSAVKPVYPPAARANETQGVVALDAVISADGSIASLQLSSSGSAELAQAAMDAVRQWRYRPALLNGVPVEFSTTITVNFLLVD